MATILKFDAMKARQAAVFSIEHPNTRPPYGLGEKIADPNVHLVKDHGVYIMAHVDGDSVTDKEWEDRKSVTYAEGYNPDGMDPDVLWDRCHGFSPDDFVEAIPADMIITAPIHKDGTIRMKVTATEIRFI